MTNENRRANSAAELARADESLRAARLLTDAGLLAHAESRVYYAAYHAVVALLLAEGLEARSPTGVSQLLGLHFVRPGRLESGDARLFARLQKYRIEADYSTAFVVTTEALAEDLVACEGFLARIRSLMATILS